MLLFLGKGTAISIKDVLLIVDYKYFLQGSNRDYLTYQGENNKLLDVTEGKAPKSLIVTNREIYLSAISHTTLKKRYEKGAVARLML